MSLGDYIAASLDREIYKVGLEVTIHRNIRKWQDRPALSKGEEATISDYRSFLGQYGPEPRVLVTLADGRSRWISGADVDLPKN